MGTLRSCYAAPARAYFGGEEVTIRWYFTDPGAPRYAEGHCWEPIRYRKGRQITDDSIGELPGRRQVFYNGDNPGVIQDGTPCGTVADFRGEGTIPRLPNGQLDFARWCACAYRACVGWGVRSRTTRHLVADLAVEGLFTEYTPESRRYVGELATEGVWNELPQTGGWYFWTFGGATYTNPTPGHVCFHAEDSLNCGGTNDGQQIGHARKHYQFAEPTELHFDLSGRVERHNEGFDNLLIYVDGVLAYSRGGTGEELGCSMADISDTLDVIVSPGTHQIDVWFDTTDGLYHVGCFWCVDLTYKPVDEGEVCVEGTINEYDTRDLHWGGTLCLEGTANEDEQPEGSWAAELAQEGTANEDEQPEGSWAAELAQEGEVTEY